ncbi:hypothetical protein TZ00_05135 [Agreia bicolorata]|uniref:LysM domain-containing protein n=1 Tax=Agreia bicolorata TaxID=110935 RepID=A0ABR5CH82_9MICO|nr:hypothetical protein TZ00_05135 [Agreia bicolorata]
MAVAALIVVGVFAFRGQGEISPTPDLTMTPSSTPSTAPSDSDSSENEGTVNTPTPFSTTVLPSPMSGQEAIDALGDKIEYVAQRNGKTVDELKDLLLRDATVHVSTSGDIFFRDDFGGKKP